ncbi:MAG: glycosyltransferase [Rickettsiales bacterium]|jgi:glycosyltransferase involved in cell wall biosynthesis|nr:glycosyltransferase [Rickettsiales bacterium]
MKKISVIIPVYKVEKYLARCLDSIINQTYHNLEIICIDDGSPDNSIAILQKYAAKDPRIKIIRQKNMGLSDARNNGFAAATGEYVHFIDSDDWIDSDYYEIMLAAMESANAPVSVSGFDNENKYNASVVYDRPRVLKSLRQRVYGTRVIDVNFVWRYLARRDFLKKNKIEFPKGLRAMEDAFWTLKLVEKAPVIAIAPHTQYHYCYNESSIMNDRDSARRKARNQNMHRARAFRQNWAVRNGFILDWFVFRLLRKIKVFR